MLYGEGRSLHGLSKSCFIPSSHDRGIDREVRLAIGGHDERMGELWDRFLAQAVSKPPDVILLLLHERNLALNEPLRRYARMVHSECFRLYEAFLKSQDPEADRCDLLWTMALSTRPSWDSMVHPFEQDERRHAILDDAAAAHHFSTLAGYFKGKDPVISNVFNKIHNLPVELRRNIALYVKDEGIQSSLVVMQLISEFQTLAHLAMEPPIQFMGHQAGLYVQKSRVAGRDYVVRLCGTSFQDGELLAHPTDATDMIVEFDNFGIVNVFFHPGDEEAKGMSLRFPPARTWYQRIRLQMVEHDVRVLRKVSVLFI